MTDQTKNAQTERAETFKSLHIKGTPLILFNVWDAGSANVVAEAGAKAIATSSAAVAATHGFADGENISYDIALHALKEIVHMTDLPISYDLESGYGPEPHQVAETVKRAIELGAVGINLEDQVIGGATLYDIPVQSARIAASREAANDLGVPLFINARTDVFLKATPTSQLNDLLEEVMERGKAYHQAGADGLFVPGLVDEDAIRTLCETSPIPVNILILPNCPSHETLGKLGVSRISYGQSPYDDVMHDFAKRASAIYS